MLSRVADSLYWMGRYLERAEHTARVVNVNLNLTLDRTPTDAARHWGRLLGSLPAPPPMAVAAAPLPSDPSVDLASGEAILACVAAARENARQVREQTSSEMWEQINRLFLTVQRWRQGEAPWGGGTHEALTSVMSGVHLFQGVTDATMTHGEGWHHIELGRYVERVASTAALLDLHYRDFADDGPQPAGVSEYVEWVGLLRSCCAFEAYCRHYTADLRAARIAEFLVLNADFPRSIHFGAARIQASLRSLSALTGRRPGRPERLAGRLLASLDYGQIDELLPDLPAHLQGIGRQAGQINAAIHQQYVDYPVDEVLSA
jgi:uncharacterized alpha-E superfamily protein